MAKPKAIFYPTVEGDVKPYYDKAADAFAGPLGVKYGTHGDTVLLLNGHKANMPIKKAKAYADEQVAQQSMDEKDLEFALGKEDMLLEMQRVQRLPIWEETDAEHFGMRKEKAPIDLNTVKARIVSAVSMEDKNVLDWVKARMEGVVFDCITEGPQNPDQPTPGPMPPPPAENDSRWKRLGTDNKSPFEDTRLNQSQFPETRYYRARYIKDDKPVGISSDIVKVVTEIYPPAQP